MFSTRHHFLLTCIGYLALASPVSAQGPGWGGNGGPPGTFNSDGGWSGCAWFTGDTNCNSSSTGNPNGNGNGNGNGQGTNADFSFTSGQVSKYNHIITIHAVLACLVWVFLIPLGGILIRSGIASPHLLRIHAFLQSFSYLIYILAAGMGIYLVNEFSYGQYSMWSDPHTRIGVGILALAFLMPLLGYVHHSIYKRRAAQFKEGGPRPGRTAPGYLHLWLGRFLIVVGMINGGLGIRLASSSPFGGNSKTRIIAYGAGAGIMFLLYVIFVIMGEVRRRRERRAQVPNRRAVPMVAQQYQPVRAVDHDVPMPPTYEQSTAYLPATLGKTPNSTARYQ